ncbi:MAG: DUF4922 domain-containing protein, partial [Duncaniella sp.]|nr:DUF4922 domain-containing protein [Duncaniella sp.]
MNTEITHHSRLSTATMLKVAEGAATPYTLIRLTDDIPCISPSSLHRWETVMEMSGASFSYSDYIDAGQQERRLIDYQEGSVRDDFDFG